MFRSAEEQFEEPWGYHTYGAPFESYVFTASLSLQSSSFYKIITSCCIQGGEKWTPDIWIPFWSGANFQFDSGGFNLNMARLLCCMWIFFRAWLSTKASQRFSAKCGRAVILNALSSVLQQSHCSPAITQSPLCSPEYWIPLDPQTLMAKGGHILLTLFQYLLRWICSMVHFHIFLQHVLNSCWAIYNFHCGINTLEEWFVCCVCRYIKVISNVSAFKGYFLQLLPDPYKLFSITENEWCELWSFTV